MALTPFKRRMLPITIAATAAAGSMITSTSVHAATVKHTYKGIVAEQDRWGLIQVTITVKNKKITNVTAAASPDNPRSTQIEANAIPMLKQEVLSAQNLDINTISGATDTSDGYLTSLQSALKKAVKAKTLSSKVLQ